MLNRNQFVTAFLFLGLSCCSSIKQTLPAQTAKLGEKNTNEPVSQVEQKNAKPQVFRRIVAKISGPMADQNEVVFEIQAQTATEIFCENICSDFSLEQKAEGNVLKLTATKVSRYGNTSPSMLDVIVKIKNDQSKGQKIALSHVGVKGETVVLQDYFIKGVTNFYAIPAKMTKSMIANAPQYTAEIEGKRIEVRFEGQDFAKKIAAAGHDSVQAFIFGSLLTEKTAKGRDILYFSARKVIVPWSED